MRGNNLNIVYLYFKINNFYEMKIKTVFIHFLLENENINFGHRYFLLKNKD